jgi:hypothetical protein
MSTLVILCPQTGLPIETGITMDEATFNSSVLEGNSIDCPHCPDSHIWGKEDVITFKK